MNTKQLTHNDSETDGLDPAIALSGKPPAESAGGQCTVQTDRDETPQDPAMEHGLWVFHDRTITDDGLVASGYGSVEVPEDWEYLPRGNTFLTRRVKKGPHWVLMGSYKRKRGYRPTKGVHAPRAAIEETRAAEQAAAEKRERNQERSLLRREKVEEQYRQEFKEACLRFLDFAPEHGDLAERIATRTAEHACERHTGRVGRTSLLDLEEKAKLAVRAHIRHWFTSYDSNLPPMDDILEYDEYREARVKARQDVDEFLTEHRYRRPGEEKTEDLERP